MQFMVYSNELSFDGQRIGFTLTSERNFTLHKILTIFIKFQYAMKS